MRLTADEFYALTPRQFDALLKRHKHHTESQEFLLAQLTSWIANTSFRATEKPTSPMDFMPSQWAKKKPVPDLAKPVRMTKKRRQDIVDRLNNSLRQIAVIDG